VASESCLLGVGDRTVLTLTPDEREHVRVRIHGDSSLQGREAAPDDRTGATNPTGGRIERAQAEAMLRSSRARPATTAGFELERISCMVTSFRVGCGPPEILAHTPAVRHRITPSTASEALSHRVLTPRDSRAFL